jgi:hypothetical protein
MYEAAQRDGLDPDRLSFSQAVRVVSWPPGQPFPPPAKSFAWEALLAELRQDRCVSSRGRVVPRGRKRKVSPYPVRNAQSPRSTRRRIAVVILSAILK